MVLDVAAASGFGHLLAEGTIHKRPGEPLEPRARVELRVLVVFMGKILVDRHQRVEGGCGGELPLWVFKRETAGMAGRGLPLEASRQSARRAATAWQLRFRRSDVWPETNAQMMLSAAAAILREDAICSACSCNA